MNPLLERQLQVLIDTSKQKIWTWIILVSRSSNHCGKTHTCFLNYIVTCRLILVVVRKLEFSYLKFYP